MRGVLGVSAIGLLLVLGPPACTSILGDFTQSNSPSNDGGTDTGMPRMDGSPGSDSGSPETGSDAPGDAPKDASLQILSCKSWSSATPMLILDIPAFDSGGGSFPIHQIHLEHIGSINSARIVVSSSTATETDTTIFTVPESGGGSVQTLTFPSTGFQAERKTTGATTVLIQDFMTNAYSYYAISDTDMGGEDASTLSPVATIAPPPSVGEGNFNMAFVQTAASSFYTLASYATTTSGQYEAASWVTSGPAEWAVLLTGQQLQLGSSLVPGAGNDVYGLFAPLGTPNGGGPAPLSVFTFNGGTTPTSRAITATGETAGAIAAEQTSSGQFDLAFITISGSSAESAGVHAGQVSATGINSFKIDDLPALAFKPGGDAGFFDTTPFGGSEGSGGRWFSNGEFGILGSGGTGGSGYTGLNFYVGTTSGQWVVETAGTGSNLLPGHTVIGSAFDLSQALGDILLTFDVAWLEQLPDGSAALYFNQLNCSP